jgi:hypothetical protein
MNFKNWVETNTDWFQQSTYKINGQIYSVPKLAEWAKKNLPVRDLPIKEIEQRYIWASQLFDSDAPDDWSVRSLNTELNFPILMLEYPDGKWEIVDGNHRTWKAWKTQQESIKAYVLPSEELPAPSEL